MQYLHTMVRVADLEASLAFVRSPDGISVELLQKRGPAAAAGTMGEHAEHRKLVGTARDD